MSTDEVNYLDIIKESENFISLDISVNSTGWVKWEDQNLSMGIYHLESEADIDRKFEFKEFLKKLFGDKYFRYCFIEDVYGGVNFKTVKSLLQLNTIVDELKYEFGIKVEEIKRESNGVWKKHLRSACNYVSEIHGEHDKAMIVNCLNKLGFDKGVIDSSLTNKINTKSYQDIYDAMGLAIGVIKRDIIDVREISATGEKVKKSENKQKVDLRKGYIIKQFDDEFDALDEANDLTFSLGKGIKFLDLTLRARDLLYNFKREAEIYGDDLIYVVKIETSKIGALALAKGMDLDIDLSYLLCYRKKR